MDYKNVSIEPKKIKQGMSYTRKEKTIIMNVFKYFRSEHPDKTVTDIVRCTARATGCSEKSIFSFRKEEVSPQGFKEPSKKKIRTKVSTNNRLVKYNENVREAIRNIIFDLKDKNMVPTLNVILKSMRANNLPTFSLMTLRRLLCDMGFYYEKSGNKSILAEKKSINKNSTNSNKPLVPKEPVEPSKTNSTEVLESFGDTGPSTIPNEIVGNKHSMLMAGHAPHSAGRKIMQGITAKKCDDNLHTYHGINIPQNPGIQVLRSYQENHYPGLGPPPASHMPPMMFPTRMPPYHLHSSVPHSYHSNVDLHLKREETYISPSHPQLPPHYTIMH